MIIIQAAWYSQVITDLQSSLLASHKESQWRSYQDLYIAPTPDAFSPEDPPGWAGSCWVAPSCSSNPRPCLRCDTCLLLRTLSADLPASCLREAFRDCELQLLTGFLIAPACWKLAGSPKPQSDEILAWQPVILALQWEQELLGLQSRSNVVTWYLYFMSTLLSDRISSPDYCH